VEVCLPVRPRDGILMLTWLVYLFPSTCTECSAVMDVCDCVWNDPSCVWKKMFVKCRWSSKHWTYNNVLLCFTSFRLLIDGYILSEGALVTV